MGKKNLILIVLTLLITSILTVSGGIELTSTNCDEIYNDTPGNEPQYDPGQTVYLLGTGFENETVQIIAEGKASSCDSDIIIFNVTRTIDSSGNFCTPIYKIRQGDYGSYEVTAGSGSNKVFKVRPNSLSDVSLCCEDLDDDGICDTLDNCLNLENPFQYDTDGDNVGNECDEDDDNDNVNDTEDNCRTIYNPPVEEWIDYLNNSYYNSQPDYDLDGIGDACEEDIDFEICDANDNDNDGLIDEDLKVNYGSNTGECSYGEKTCDLGQWTITLNSTDSTIETCDGLDNDCDGSTDEIFNVGDACQSQSNSCDDTNNGFYTCKLDGTGTTCDASTPLERINWNISCNSEPNICNETNPGYTNCEGICDASTPQAQDQDDDGVPDCLDNCQTIKNSFQEDLDGDDIGDACDTPICGNGFTEFEEECDDNNMLLGDGCSDTCKFEYCNIGEFSLSGKLPCESCASGTYQNETGQDSCKSCEPYENSLTGSASCYTNLWTQISLNKTAQDLTGGELTINDSVKYTLTINNTGTNNAYNVIVTDNLPSEVTCINITGDVNLECSQNISWEIPQLNVFESKTLYVYVNINNGTSNRSIINIGYVSATNLNQNNTNTTPSQEICAGGSISINGTCPNLCIPNDEICDFKDNNCDGIIDEGCQTCTDNDNDGFFTNGGYCGVKDCSDDNSKVYPGAQEICTNNIDDDCDGLVNEGCSSGGGGGGGSTSNCIENWNCTEWDTCTTNSTQIRTCSDLKACGTENDKPAEIQNCTYIELLSSGNSNQNFGLKSSVSEIVCGDEICQSPEDFQTCPQDCDETNKELDNSTIQELSKDLSDVTGRFTSDLAKTNWWMALIALIIVSALIYAYYNYVYGSKKGKKNKYFKVY